MKELISELITERFLAANFCTYFEESSHACQVGVAGFGEIKLPIQPKAAKQLISLAEPSKFGFKEQTLYDLSVRKSFEISSELISLSTGFTRQINKALVKISTELRFPPNSELQAKLHNMLIYEKGGFFDFHQDSEKEENMMASLVVVLPSNYRGGSMVIEYHGQQKILGDVYGNHQNNNKLQFLAFYADCPHKLHKITYGYRVALTFNIILENPTELKNQTSTNKLNDALIKYFASKPQPKHSYFSEKHTWFIYLLNHQYTANSLSWSKLKGEDLAAAATFKQAAQDLELDIYLVLVKTQETWDVDYDNYYYARKHIRNFDHNIEDLMLNSIINSESTLSIWLDANGQAAGFDDCFVDNSMIFMVKDNSNYSPYDSEHEGYMGNYGNTLDKWYKRTAIVLWPKKHSFDAKFTINFNTGLTALLALLSEDQSLGLIAYESVKPKILHPYVMSKIPINKILQLIVLLNNQKHLTEILSNCNMQQILKMSKHDFAQMLQNFGEQAVNTAILSIQLTWERSADKSAIYKDFIRKIYADYLTTANSLLNVWIAELKKDFIIPDDISNDVEKRDYYIKNTQNSLLKLVTCLELRLADLQNYIKDIFDAIADNYKHLNPIFIYEIFHNESLYEHFSKLPRYLEMQQLAVANINSILEQYSDACAWQIDEVPYCHCALCLELKKFLISNQQEKVWPTGKENRMHIQHIIDCLKIPVSYATVSAGRPYQLVLTKQDNITNWKRSRYIRFKKLLAKPR